MSAYCVDHEYLITQPPNSHRSGNRWARISTYLSLDITEAPTYWILLVSMGYKFGHENDFKRRWYGIGWLGMAQKVERANIESRRERRLLSFEDTKVGEWRLLKYLLLYYQDKKNLFIFFLFPLSFCWSR